MACVVDIRHVSKYFAKVAANKDVSLTVDAGQVVALLGENGAGKSTIMKILYGLYAKDEGEILIDGVPQQIHSPKDAMACGIAMIQQHFSLLLHSLLRLSWSLTLQDAPRRRLRAWGV